jgi:hypothetical protein
MWPVRLVAISLAAGFALGTSGRASDHLPPLLHWAGAVGALWLIGAFAVGALAGGRRAAALAGAVAIVSGVAAYYMLMHWVEHRAGLRYAVIVGVAWGAGGALVGALFGWAGHAWRHGSPRLRPVGVAVLGGALLGEAVLLLDRWRSPDARAVLLAELVLGVTLPLALAGRRRGVLALGATAVVATMAVVLEAALRIAMHRVGWRG